MRYQLDISARSVVGVCACGIRVLALTRTSALTQLADHHIIAHTGPNRARQAINQATRRTTA